MSFNNKTIEELHDLLVSKEISATELTQATLDDIKAREEAVNAFVTVAEEAALAQAKAIDEKGIDVNTGKVLVEVDSKYFRPCEVEQLLGDPTKAKTVLGWNPTKTSFPELVRIMVAHDMKFVKKLYLKSQVME